MRHSPKCHDELWERLPQVDSVSGGEIQPIVRLYGEGAVPHIQIAHRVDTVLGRGVAVRHDGIAQSGFAVLAAPNLRKAEKELLIAS